MTKRMSWCVVALMVMSPDDAGAQSAPAGISISVPRLINVSGVFEPANGQPASAVETVTLSIYTDQEGGAPLWQETQAIALDAQGRYTVLLGVTQPDGIPSAVFGTGEAKWLGTMFQRVGEVEGPRVRITSVPYALRAADADTLGGRPASAYLLAPGADGTADAQAASEPGGSTANLVLPGTANYLAKYVNGDDVGSSGVFEAADGGVGLGTTTPFDRLHVRYNNNTGDLTGLAVQNVNGGALAYSGMLFYDHTNALTLFQGYNNLTHEYRINNIARVSPGGAFNGSINFMTASTSRLFVAPDGNVGIGTPAPNSSLHLRSGSATGFAIQMENTNTAKRLYIGNYGTVGGGNHWSGLDSANTSFLYAENPLILTTPGGIHFSGSTTAEHMGITASGNVGIGTATPSYKFQVNSGNANQFAAHIQTDGLGQGTSYGLEINAGTDAFDSALQIRNQAGGALVRVRGNGYVGIGTTNALSPLHVVTATKTDYAARIQHTASASGLLVQVASGANNTREYPLRIENPPGNLLFGVDENGFVQIGGVPLSLNLVVGGDSVFGGYVKIPTRAPYAGNAAFLCRTDDGTVSDCPSSIRFKTNVQSSRLGLDLIKRLRPVTFDWINNGAHDFGLIAEEVEEVEPLLATYQSDGQILGVKYERVGVVLVNAFKEQQDQIESLRDVLKAQQDLLSRMKALLCGDRPGSELCR